MRAQTTYLMSVVLCALIAGCTISQAGSRTNPKERKPTTIGAAVRPCSLAKTVSGALRKTALERHWRELEQHVEQPLRQIVSSGATVRLAFESLDERVLEPHDWSLTRYLVRLLREIEVPDLGAAQRLLQVEAYAQHALRDAAWDASNGWDVVDRVRGETVQLLAWIDDVRTGRVTHFAEGTSADLPKLAQDVTDRLLEAAKNTERYSMASDCQEPEDPIA